eukprot:1151033-Alexandrium_andersonii.AAC.1
MLDPPPSFDFLLVGERWRRSSDDRSPSNSPPIPDGIWGGCRGEPPSPTGSERCRPKTEEGC